MARNTHSVRAEMLAEIAAMEFLFPYAARVQELQKAEPIDFKAVADKYGVPQYLVEIYLHPAYMAELGAMVR